MWRGAGWIGICSFPTRGLRPHLEHEALLVVHHGLNVGHCLRCEEVWEERNKRLVTSVVLRLCGGVWWWGDSMARGHLQTRGIAKGVEERGVGPGWRK